MPGAFDILEYRKELEKNNRIRKAIKKEHSKSKTEMQVDPLATSPKVSSNPNIPVPHSDKLLYSNVSVWINFCRKRLSFYEYFIPADGDCGYHALGISRAKAVTQLLEHMEDDEVRTFVASEIEAAVFEGNISDLLRAVLGKSSQGQALFQTIEQYYQEYCKLGPLLSKIKQDLLHAGRQREELRGLTAEQLITILEGSNKLLLQNKMEELEGLRKKIKDYATSREVFSSYVRFYIAIPGQWLVYLPSIGGQQQHSSVDAIAKINKFNINILEELEKNRPLILRHEGIFDRNYPTVYIRFNKNHYTRLETKQNLKIFPVVTTAFELLQSYSEPDLYKKEQIERNNCLSLFFDKMEMCDLDLSKTLLQEFTLIIDAIYQDKFQINEQLVQTKKLNELTMLCQKIHKDFAEGKALIDDVLDIESKLTFYQESVKKVYRLLFCFMSKKTDVEKKSIHQLLQNKSTHAELFQQILKETQFKGKNALSPQIIFETKRFRFEANHQAYNAFYIIAFIDSFGKKELIYQGRHIASPECEGKLPFPKEFHINLTKEGAIQIGKFHNLNNIIFNLDHHDIQFFNNLNFAGSLEILSAKDCYVTGNITTIGSLKFQGEKFFLDKEKEIRTQSFDWGASLKSHSFVNRGLVHCEKFSSIKTQIFDNRGGRIKAESATFEILKDGHNDEGLIFVDITLDIRLSGSFRNSQGGLLSKNGNITIMEMNASDKTSLVNGRGGIIVAENGHIHGKLTRIQNLDGGSFEASSIGFHTNGNGTYGFVNDGSIRTRVGCNFHGDLLHRKGSIFNASGQLLFDSKKLCLLAPAHSGGAIYTSELEYFDYSDDVLYAVETCRLVFKTARIFSPYGVLGHKISMKGFLEIIVVGGTDSLANHTVIQAAGIKVITPWSIPEPYAFHNHGTLISIKDDIILQGKGLLGTLNGNGIHSARDVIINGQNCTSTASIHARRDTKIDVTQDAYIAHTITSVIDTSIAASVATLSGYLQSGRHNIVSGDRTVTFLDTAYSVSGEDMRISAGSSITSNGPLNVGSHLIFKSKEVYLNARGKAENISILGTDAIVLQAETIADEDILVKTKTLLINGTMDAGRDVLLDTDRIASMTSPVKAVDTIIVKTKESFEDALQSPFKAKTVELHLPSCPKFPAEYPSSLAIYLSSQAKEIRLHQDFTVFGNFTIHAPHLPLYLQNIITATGNLHCTLLALDILRGALVAGMDCSVDCQGPIQVGHHVDTPTAIISGGKTSFSGTQVQFLGTDVQAKQGLRLEGSQSVEVFYCELRIEGETIVLSPKFEQKKKLTPTEIEEIMSKQQEEYDRQIEEWNKQCKKKKRKMIFKSVIAIGVGAGLAAFLGPQMLTLLTNLGGLSATAMEAGVGVLQGMVSGGVSAAITKQKVLKAAIEGGAFAGLGQMLDGIKLIQKMSSVVAREATKAAITTTINTGMNGGPLLTNLAVGVGSSALGTALVGAPNTGVLSHEHIMVETLRNVTRAGATAAVSRAVRGKKASTPLTASLLGSALSTVASRYAGKLSRTLLTPQKSDEENKNHKEMQDVPREEVGGAPVDKTSKGYPLLFAYRRRRSSIKNIELEKRSDSESIGKIKKESGDKSTKRGEPIYKAKGVKVSKGLTKNVKVINKDTERHTFSESASKRKFEAMKKTWQADFKVKTKVIKEGVGAEVRLYQKEIVPGVNSDVRDYAEAGRSSERSLEPGKIVEKHEFYAGIGRQLLTAERDSPLGSTHAVVNAQTATISGTAVADASADHKFNFELTGDAGFSAASGTVAHKTPVFAIGDKAVQCEMRLEVHALGARGTAGVGIKGYKTKFAGQLYFQAGLVAGPAGGIVRTTCRIDDISEMVNPEDSPIVVPLPSIFSNQ